MNWLTRTFFPTKHNRDIVVERLFREIETKARDPELFRAGKMPDTLDGRFQAIALFSALIFPRLERSGEQGRAISSHLYRRLFQSFDDALRETGVGDASIARKIRKMGEEFFGLAEAVAAALLSDNPRRDVEAVLARNGIASGTGRADVAEDLVTDDERLRTTPEERLLAGELDW